MSAPASVNGTRLHTLEATVAPLLTESGGRLRFAEIVADCFRATQKFESFSCGPAIAFRPSGWSGKPVWQKWTNPL